MTKVAKGLRDQITLIVNAEMMLDYGEYEELPIEMTFIKINKQSEAKKIFAEFRTGDLGVLDTIRKYLVKWDLTWKDGSPIQLDNDEDMELIWEYEPYAQAMVDGFGMVQLGYKKMQSKNS
ncbi:MAG: hypothetical protein JAY88_14770 [Candidatus Thiodiazotropha lotti]|nr:hypothetical protein [Candidatus Thiodiazotropha lotti]MCW4188327.1 hypothetical protein [Candidatus Thiodiazotropha lotti]